MTVKKEIYAGFWTRMIASIIDILITSPFLIVIAYLLGSPEYNAIKIDEDFYSYNFNSISAKGNFIADLFSWAVTICYSIFFLTSKKQATIGKRIMGIYVATKNGKKLTAPRALARFVTSIFSVLLFFIGVFMIAFTKEKTALHDLICGTRVLNGKIV